MLWLLICSPALADNPADSLTSSNLTNNLGSGQSDVGGIGLMQTPTARMGKVGHFAISWSRTSPYRHYSVSLQPLDWLELGFRHTSTENRNDRNQGIDAKFRLHKESRYWPELALGLRDAGANSPFSAEYLVASKRWYDIDFTLGLGWGYLGNRGDTSSPLGWIDSRFDTRPAGHSKGGKFTMSPLFRGPVALFGGIEYQTPWKPLVLQLEYEGNDYAHEPQGSHQTQDSRFNVGARYRLSDNIELRAGWERGNTAMAGVSLSTSLAGLTREKQDPPPHSLKPYTPASHARANKAKSDTARIDRTASTINTNSSLTEPNWAVVADSLQSNAGIRVATIHQTGHELTVTGEPTTFRSLNQAEGRASRILHNQADSEIASFRFRWQQRGLALREDVHNRAALVNAAGSKASEIPHRYGIYAHAQLASLPGEPVYRGEDQRFSWHVGPAIEQNTAGPDGYLYRLSAYAAGEYTTDANGWLSGSVTGTLADNLGNYEHADGSRLPRVRSHLGDYLSKADIGITNLQYTRTAKLSDNLYAMGYGGLLEMMYAGAGAELLYRPFNSGWALGLDMNWVRQRDFDQLFGLRGYSTWTGHATAYMDTGYKDILAKLSVGRYLAGDLGATLDLSREFNNGVRVGARTTFTDARNDDGTNSFDKAFYISIPFDAFFIHASRDRSNITWQPLTRDSGARLNRRYKLYPITQPRELGRYWQEYDKTWE